MVRRFNELKLTSIFFLILLLFSVSIPAGDMAPDAPPASTMKNLQTVEPRIAIDSYGYTITESGSYYLTRNIQMLIAANGINVEADNVSIDLMGYTLSGNGAGSVSGVYMNGRSNVEVRNGIIRNFGGQGIYEADGVNGKSHRVIDVRVVGNGGDGIHLEGSGHTIRGCTAEGNGTTGIYLRNMGSVIANTSFGNGSGIRAGLGTVVHENAVYNNQHDGIYLEYGCNATENTSASNGGSGISAPSGGSRIVGNTVRNNSSNGIMVINSCDVSKNICENNGYQNGVGAGVKATGSSNSIKENNIFSNDQGLAITSGGNIVKDNVVKSNADNYYIAPENQLEILLCEVPETIDWPAKVVFAGTLKCEDASVSAIGVNASDVTIDMAGHSLVGVGSELSTHSGIRITNGNNITVMNGTVKNFYYGIFENNENEGAGHIFKNLIIDSNSKYGIYIGSRDINIIQNCVFKNHAQEALNTDNSLIDGCVFFNNTEDIFGCWSCTYGTNHFN